MAFNINDFRISMRNSEVANPTNYEVEILQEPEIIQNVIGLGNYFPDVIKYRCETCSLPSKALKYINQTIYGPPRKVAYSAEYQDTSFSFIATDSMIEKEYFSLWQTGIVNNDVNSSYANENVNNVTYYDNYVGQLAIKVYDKSGYESYRVTFYEAYPTVVQETPLSWNSNNDYIRITVILTYKYFVEERYSSNVSANVILDIDPTTENRESSSQTSSSSSSQTSSPSTPTRNLERVEIKNENERGGTFSGAGATGEF